MHISAFEAALAKGLGRPLLYLQTRDARPYREAILYACTHDMRHDRQTEDRRSQYYFELIQATREPKFYRDRLLSALLAPAEDEYVTQLIEIMRRFAQQGDGFARQAVYSAIIRDAAENDFSDAEELIHLDGIDGLLFVVERYLTSDPEEDDDWMPGWWIDLLAERNGKETAAQELEQAASSVPAFGKWLAEVRLVCQQREQRPKPFRQPRMDYASLKAFIAAGRKNRVRLWSWGRDASEEELKEAAADLLAEQDPHRLLSYLYIFWEQTFPGDHQRLLTLTHSDDEKIAWAAMTALTHIQHPNVRKFALDLMQQPRWYGNSVDILSRNYQHGDYQLVESLLEQTLDPDDYHTLGLGVNHLTEAHPTPEAERSLLLLYENGPCSICRCSCVDHLIALNRLPEWIRAECRYDAYSHTREAVEQSAAIPSL